MSLFGIGNAHDAMRGTTRLACAPQRWRRTGAIEKDARQDGATAGLRRMMEIRMWLPQGSATGSRQHVLQIFSWFWQQ
ncbi:hypothetical protein GQ37_009650 [Janthinobacterium sp. BJB1]|nr:hypothetical protein GQ37_009650 [Janthinobacterium sp. BJB1]